MAEDGRKHGRQYQPSFIEEARELCGDRGYTDVQLGRHFGVSRNVVNRWKREHPEFAQVLLAAKKQFDDAHVVKATLKRALGYDVPWEERVEGGRWPTITKGVKHFPPDATCCIFWLCNRQREEWQNVSTIEHTGGGPPMPMTILDFKALVAAVKTDAGKDEPAPLLKVAQ